MKNPVRIAKRHLQKKHANPNLEIGLQLWKSRENRDLTQWELASAVTQLLDLQKLIDGQLGDILDESSYPIAPSALEIIKFELGLTIAKLTELNLFLRNQETQWIDSAIAFILNIEVQVGKQLERARKEAKLTQDQLSERVTKQLDLIDTPGPPGRAGISKIERGERRMDLLEAWAIAIALQQELGSLLPHRLAKLLPATIDPVSHWHPVAVYGNTRQYRSEGDRKLASIACESGLSIPPKFARKIFTGADNAA